MSIFTAERMVKLAYNYPHLHSLWYLVACAALTVTNQPNEIPKIFHFALRQQLLDFNPNVRGLLTNKYLLQLAQDLIALAQKYGELTAVGVLLPEVLIPYNLHDKLPLEFKYKKSDDISAQQQLIAAKFREVIMKLAALLGLPKCINALMILKTVTPNLLKPAPKPERVPIVNPGHLSLSDIVGEDVEGTCTTDTYLVDTIDGPISVELVNPTQIHKTLKRGSDFWNSVYLSKVNKRIRNQMYNAYPDLWYYAFHHVYSPLLLYTGVLSAKETLMCVCANLMPQDVNPQLKGHLRGAINVGNSKEEMSEVRDVVFDICEWTGGNYWRDGRELVAKL